MRKTSQSSLYDTDGKRQSNSHIMLLAGSFYLANYLTNHWCIQVALNHVWSTKQFMSFTHKCR